MKKKLISCFFIMFFVVSFSFSFSNTPNVPGKCCDQTDSLKTETKKIEVIKEPLTCTKKEDKKEGRDFSIMSLNLMYYLINKFISAPSFDQD